MSEEKLAGFMGFDLGCNKNEDGSITIVIVGEGNEQVDGYVAELVVTPERALQLADLIKDVVEDNVDADAYYDDEDEDEYEEGEDEDE